jgi:hypothetical protein
MKLTLRRTADDVLGLEHATSTIQGSAQKGHPACLAIAEAGRGRQRHYFARTNPRPHLRNVAGIRRDFRFRRPLKSPDNSPG